MIRAHHGKILSSGALANMFKGLTPENWHLYDVTLQVRERTTIDAGVLKDLQPASKLMYDRTYATVPVVKEGESLTKAFMRGTVLFPALVLTDTEQIKSFMGGGWSAFFHKSIVAVRLIQSDSKTGLVTVQSSLDRNPSKCDRAAFSASCVHDIFRTHLKLVTQLQRRKGMIEAKKDEQNTNSQAVVMDSAITIIRGTQSRKP